MVDLVLATIGSGMLSGNDTCVEAATGAVYVGKAAGTVGLVELRGVL